MKHKFEVPTEWRQEWPGSVLAGCKVEVTEADNGDLLELKAVRAGVEVDVSDLESSELSAALEQHFITEASKLGRDAGRAAGSWAADGNTKQQHITNVLKMLDDGDPEASDYLPPTPNLSGEWADDLTPAKLFEEVVGREATERDAELKDTLATAWEDGVMETFENQCEKTLRSFSTATAS